MGIDIDARVERSIRSRPVHRPCSALAPAAFAVFIGGRFSGRPRALARPLTRRVGSTHTNDQDSPIGAMGFRIGQRDGRRHFPPPGLTLQIWCRTALSGLPASLPAGRRPRFSYAEATLILGLASRDTGPVLLLILIGIVASVSGYAAGARLASTSLSRRRRRVSDHDCFF